MALLNAEEYATLMNESRAAAACRPFQGCLTPPAWARAPTGRTRCSKRAPMANHSVLYTNGTETSSIAMGASHFSQDGIMAERRDA